LLITLPTRNFCPTERTGNESLLRRVDGEDTLTASIETIRYIVDQFLVNQALGIVLIEPAHLPRGHARRPANGGNAVLALLITFCSKLARHL
jgi:hypothetical protein